MIGTKAHMTGTVSAAAAMHPSSLVRSPGMVCRSWFCNHFIKTLWNVTDYSKVEYFAWIESVVESTPHLLDNVLVNGLTAHTGRSIFSIKTERRYIFCSDYFWCQWKMPTICCRNVLLFNRSSSVKQLSYYYYCSCKHDGFKLANLHRPTYLRRSQRSHSRICEGNRPVLCHHWIGAWRRSEFEFLCETNCGKI